MNIKILLFKFTFIFLLFSQIASANPLEKLISGLKELQNNLDNISRNIKDEASDFNISDRKMPSKDSIKFVEVVGVGETLETSKEDAVRQAVQKTVGSYVTSDLIIKNDSVIKDKVISLSSAFVEKTEIISQLKRNDGLFETKIRATVSTTSLRRALEEQNIATSDLDSESLFGEALTKLDTTNSTLTLWNELLTKLISSGFNAQLVGKPTIEPISGDDVFLSFKVLMDWNSEYKKEISNLLKTTSHRRYSVGDYGGGCKNLWVDSHCVDFKDINLTQQIEKIFLEHNSPIKLELLIKNKNGEQVGYITNCLGTNLSGHTIVNPFVATDRGVQLFLNKQLFGINGTRTHLNRFGLANFDKQSFLNSSFRDKANRPLIEFTNNSSVFITVSAVISKNDLLNFNSVDVKTGGCSGE